MIRSIDQAQNKFKNTLSFLAKNPKNLETVKELLEAYNVLLEYISELEMDNLQLSESYNDFRDGFIYWYRVPMKEVIKDNKETSEQFSKLFKSLKELKVKIDLVCPN